MIDQIPDGSLDFAYVDGDHTLRGITVDLIKVFPKVREGGWIGGDDFSPSIWQHSEEYEPTLVFPLAVHFAEAMDARIYGLPHKQFLIEKAADSGHAFVDLTGRYGDLELKRQLDRRQPAHGLLVEAAQPLTPQRVRFIVPRVLACLIVLVVALAVGAGRRGPRRLVPGAGLQAPVHDLDRQGHLHRRRRHDLRRRQRRPHEQAAARPHDRPQRDGADASTAASRAGGAASATRSRRRARLEQLIRASRWRVRLAALDPGSHSGVRPRRAVAVRIDGRWRDVGTILLAEGHALFLPNRSEWAWNAGYSPIAEQAAAAGAGLWNPTYCGLGPSDASPLRVIVNADADGADEDNLNGEWMRVRNLDTVNEVHLGGWWLRDSALNRYVFPDWATLPPGESLTVYVGKGTDTWTEFFWKRKCAGLRERERRRARAWATAPTCSTRRATCGRT